jgi:hypothetical protein
MKIDDAHARVLLAEAINSSDSLFDFHRIPRQVVVYECTAKLEIESLGRSVRAGEHIGFPFSESPFDIVARDDPPCPIGIANFASTAGKTDYP